MLKRTLLDAASAHGKASVLG